MNTQIFDAFNEWIIIQRKKWEQLKADVINAYPETKKYLDQSYLVITCFSQTGQGQYNIEGIVNNILMGCQVEARFRTVNMPFIARIEKHANVVPSSFGIRIIIEGKYEYK